MVLETDSAGRRADPGDAVSSGLTSTTRPVRIGVVGLGKMGLSHLADRQRASGRRGRRRLRLAPATCSTSSAKYTGRRDLRRLRGDARRGASSTRSSSRRRRALHAAMVRDGARARASTSSARSRSPRPGRLASSSPSSRRERGLVTQVGYHNRFVGAFREVKRLLDAGAIGAVTHVARRGLRAGRAQAARAAPGAASAHEGGGCLYDYAAHPLNLLTWYFGRAGGGRRHACCTSVFSRETDDEVHSTLLLRRRRAPRSSRSNWSDESHRKMTTKITLWGTDGRIFADRQEMPGLPARHGRRSPTATEPAGTSATRPS